MVSLRDYQQQAIADLRRSLAQGHQAPLFVLATGGGKTAVAGEQVRSAVAKGRSVVFLAPRRELIFQASERLRQTGVQHGVIMSGEPASLLQQVQVASIPTLYRRCIVDERMPLPTAHLVIVDEAHIGVGGQAQKILDAYLERGAKIVGLTATPARTDGRALGLVYDDMVLGPSVAELTERGCLVPARYFSGDKPDTSGVQVKGGDYVAGQLEQAVDDPKLVGDVVSNWARIAYDRPTFVFAAGVAHSRHLCDRFRAVGINAEHIDGDTDNDERAAIQERLRQDETQVICNCQVMTYGVDFPPVSCIVLARPTKSVATYLQMVGRGLRPSPDTGKQDCVVIDHAGAVSEIGFVDEPMPWSLDGREKVQDRLTQQRRERKEPREITCPHCSTVFRARQHCPSCGAEMRREHRQAIEELEADLEEIDRQTRQRKSREWTISDKARFYSELLGYARHKGYKDGWAAHVYKERLGVWPNDKRIKHVSPRPAGPDTLGWIKHRQIKRAKRKEAA